MRRADGRYKGRRPRGGLTAGQVCVTAVTVILAVLLMTMKVNSQWCGMSVGEQLYEAVFVTEDWS